MDKYDVKLMDRAARDLDGIYSYIAKRLLAIRQQPFLEFARIRVQ